MDHQKDSRIKNKNMELIYKFAELLKNSKILGKIIHTEDYALGKALKDCESVLDLGCGYDSPVQKYPWLKYKVGVEIFEPYLEQSKQKNIHNQYILSNLKDINFPPKSFDAVILISVIEHLPKQEALDLIKKAEKIAIKKVILVCPNGVCNQKFHHHGNKYQEHLCEFNAEELLALQYKTYGLGGLKKLMTGESTESHILSGVKYRPQLLFFIINGFFQMFIYYLPKYSFGLIAVKKYD